MPSKIFVDTSGFFAFLNKSDTNHKIAVERLTGNSRLITSNYVFDELMTLLTAREKKEASIPFGEQIRGENWCSYHYLTTREEEKAWQLYKKYRDHPLSFTDCTTLTLLQEHKIGEFLIFDRTLVPLAQQRD